MYGSVGSVMVNTVGNGQGNRSSNSGRAVYFSLETDHLGKGMKPTCPSNYR